MKPLFVIVLFSICFSSSVFAGSNRNNALTFSGFSAPMVCEMNLESNTVQSDSPSVKTPEIEPETEYSSDIGAMYSSGDKIKTGVRVFYNMLTQKENSRMTFGFGYNLEVLSIENKNDGFTGTMLTYGGNLLLRAMLTDAPVSPFVGLQGTLTFGNETIDYGYKKESSFYFGPYVRETIGVSFDKKVFLEAGVYQIKLFGSKMLPDDIGFCAGLAVGI
jgi:hypothetical protein